MSESRSVAHSDILSRVPTLWLPHPHKDNCTCVTRFVGLTGVGSALLYICLFTEKSVGWDGKVLNSHICWLCTLGASRILSELISLSGFWHFARTNWESRRKFLTQCLTCSICLFSPSAEHPSSVENRASVQGPNFTMTNDSGFKPFSREG